MINFRKLIATKAANSLARFVVLGTVFLSACNETEKPEEFVARVNDSFLTKQELESKLGDDRYSQKHREELIRGWIETEVLYQEAASENILEDTLYKQIIVDSRKNLASAFLIQDFFRKNPVKVSDEEVRQYYDERKEEFRFSSDVYIYNLAGFSDELKAIYFRNMLIETDWSKANDAFSEDESLLYKASELLKHDYELNPPVIGKILKYLRGNEVSIIFETEPGLFNVVQLVEKIDKGEVPKLKFVRKMVTSRLSMLKKRELYLDYMDDLLSKYNVVINRYEE
jgi:hypothetical protein